MNDIDHLKVMLNQWNVPHKQYADTAAEEDEPQYAQVIKVGGYTHQSDPRNTVSGYNGFFTLFNFDEAGKFVSMGAWE